ncbi:MAG TPA: Asp-tRNA(Asn)/Glu-tRNA(Gln) amidotransferase subunit GatB [Gemmataceae bacterium]|jgi:aspartyl-tRNA(Asn)/glutamyl-tRNA(Gln) amidotransferase subunit B|nr:Asp-tRNA(Asn)/Glu-tRNA(Gln) amidotransferase subunit GatB [Gemmataceae bacterium]
MPDSYTLVIGLEVHVQLLTRTKLFCGCPNRFGLPPNSATCPVCLGLPGVLPVMNRAAFELALKAAMALNCRIAGFTKWDRKNYYYPDLPKNYQISQYDLPFSEEGYLEIATAAGPKKVGLIRVHLEEDAGKLVHDESGGGKESKVDLNRTGTPLLEIVSRPDINTPEEASTYLQELRLLLRELDVSDCEMQEGSLRCDANVNLHIPQPDGSVAATPIVEVKNLNSFRAVERAMKYEANRQSEQFQRDGKRMGDVSKATAGWEDAKGVTRIQRRKEEASDYRYFPDPDLMPVEVDEAWRNRVRATLGELPAAQRGRLQSEYGLSEYDATVLTRQGRRFVSYFEEAARASGDAKAVANWTTNEVLSSLNERKQSIAEFPLTAARLGGFVRETKSAGLNKQRARDVYAHMLEHDTDAAGAIAALGITAVADEGQIRDLLRQGIAANPQAVADYKKGKVRAADRIKGFVMKQTKGMANTELVQRLLEEELANN